MTIELRRYAVLIRPTITPDRNSPSYFMWECSAGFSSVLVGLDSISLRSEAHVSLAHDTACFTPHLLLPGNHGSCDQSVAKDLFAVYLNPVLFSFDMWKTPHRSMKNPAKAASQNE